MLSASAAAGMAIFNSFMLLPLIYADGLFNLFPVALS